jgi:hypothetical protein
MPPMPLYKALPETKNLPPGENVFYGLPDSVDIVNLWMGIPTKDWQPLALADMQFCQTAKRVLALFRTRMQVT